mgnify:CR=1 FL=1
MNNYTIKIFNYGNCKRDFTYIDDIVKGIVEVMQRSPQANDDGVRFIFRRIRNLPVAPIYGRRAGVYQMLHSFISRLDKIRQEQKTAASEFIFLKGNLADKAFIDRIFKEYTPDIVVNLAAQAGVRYSITNPDAYLESNVIGFYNILEACRHSYDDGKNNIVDIGKIALAIPVIENLNRLILHQFIRESKIRHIRTPCWSVYRKET